MGALKENKKFAMICLPGGMPGATNLYNDKTLTSLITDNLKNNPGFILGAICASPAVVLSQNGMLKGLPCTGYPVDKFKQLIAKNGGKYQNDSVVIAAADKSIIVTSQGPGTALEFSLVLVQLLFGFQSANKIAVAMLTLFGTEYVD